MDNHANKGIRDKRSELAELQFLLKKAVQQNNDPEAVIAAKHFRYLIQKRIRDNAISNFPVVAERNKLNH